MTSYSFYTTAKRRTINKLYRKYFCDAKLTIREDKRVKGGAIVTISTKEL